MLRRDRGSTQADGLLWLLRHITAIATKRNNSPRMPRPSSVLDGGGSRVETFGFPKLLQYGPRSRVAGESDSDSGCGIQTGRSQMLRVAETMSWLYQTPKAAWRRIRHLQARSNVYRH